MPSPATLLAFAMVAYLVGTIGAGFAGAGEAGRIPRRFAAVAVVIGWLCHSAALAIETGASGRFAPVNLAGALVLFGWAVITAHLVVGVRGRIDAAAWILPPLALVSIGVAAALPASTPATGEQGRGAWFVFHTATATLGMAVLTVPLAMSLIYLVLDRALKAHRRLTWLARLPPLERCDRIGYRALLVGFGLLTIGIVTGVVVSVAEHARPVTFTVKQSAPILAWAVFAVVLGTRAALGFRGRRAAYLTIVGVAIGLATVAGISV